MYEGLDGKVALITGGARGIGLATAEVLVASGVSVALADRDVATAQEAAGKFRANGAPALACELDVADPLSIAAGFEAASELGEVSLLVNSAGIVTQSPLADFPLSDWDRVVDVNLRGVFLCIQEFTRRRIAASAGGAVVNVASMSYKGMTRQIAYASAKGGVVSLTKSAAMELARHGIRVNCVAPGMTETEMVSVEEQGRDSLRERMTAAIPMRRYGQPREIAHPIAFLLSEGASYLTGDTIHASGGARV